MVNKKGFIRTLEAVIAIILILGFIFWIIPKGVGFEEEIPEDVVNAKEFILNQILFNKEYGECIANANVVDGISSDNECKKALEGCDEHLQSIMDLFGYVPYGYAYACEICQGSESCIPRATIPRDKSVYTNTIFIYTPINKEYNIMRIYIWKKGE